MEFGRLGRRVLSADFDGGALSSDGGLMLLRRVDERIGLSRAAASVLSDARNPDRITHDMRALVAQRLYALCCGYEDLNDHSALRRDPLMQTAVPSIKFKRNIAKEPKQIQTRRNMAFRLKKRNQFSTTNLLCNSLTKKAPG